MVPRPDLFLGKAISKSPNETKKESRFAHLNTRTVAFNLVKHCKQRQGLAPLNIRSIPSNLLRYCYQQQSLPLSYISIAPQAGSINTKKPSLYTSRLFPLGIKNIMLSQPVTQPHIITPQPYHIGTFFTRIKGGRRGCFI